MDRLASGGLKVCAGKDARTLCAEQEDKPQSERRFSGHISDKRYIPERSIWNVLRNFKSPVT